MKKLALLTLLLVAGAMFAAGFKTPETSRLFRKYVEPKTKVVSYILNSDIAANLQSMYFTQKSMSEDGRFIVLMIQGGKHGQKKNIAIVDFKTDTIEALTVPAYGADIPYFDTVTAKLYYTDKKRGFFYRDLRADIHKEVRLCDMPEEITRLGKISHVCTHLTLTRDRKKVFCDFGVDDRFVYGLVNFETGHFEQWGEAKFFFNHGQLCPTDDALALGAWEVAYKDKNGVMHGIYRLPIDEAKKVAVPNSSFSKKQVKNGVYPRMWLMSKDGKQYMIPPGEKNYATHEHWSEDGKYVYYCGGAFTIYEVKTGKTTKITNTPANHATMSANNKYVTFDAVEGKGYRGCSWKVAFLNRETGKEFFFYTARPPYNDEAHPSKMHPDPHPHFVCGDKYIICTISRGDGNMDFSITPVRQLIQMTR